MTQKEKKLILQAIYQLHSDSGDYYEGIHILCELLGLQPPYILMDKLHEITLDQVRISKVSDFILDYKD